ncbi:MAG: helix-turn-helix domain-containing protein [Desulfarculales bacterium]|jgi:transcriptional regulator with XRE-family HTH domain|nr:helix-turn-helix domain-containing protein [Desulfarculales bacterium]
MIIVYFSERLIQARHLLGLTQAEMALKIGKSTGGYQAYEQGRKMPGGDVFYKLHSLGVNIHWLLSGEGEMLLSGQGAPFQEGDSARTERSDNEESEIFMNMPSSEFWDLFNRYAQISPVQAGWAQMEIVKRFPEFRRWLKKQSL